MSFSVPPIFRNRKLQVAALFLIAIIILNTISVSSVVPRRIYNNVDTYIYQIKHEDVVPSPPLPPPDEEEYLAICMLVRNQGQDLPEVLTHHYYHMGIRRFYIMDDGSEPPLSSIRDFGIPSSAITFHVLSHKGETVKGRQLEVYNDCFKRWGSKHTWMGFFDADELLEITDPSPEVTLHSILTELAQNDTVGALAVQWLVHTSAGHSHRQPSNRASFDVCLTDGVEHFTDQYKSFVRTEFYERAMTPHGFLTRNGTVTVGENDDLVDATHTIRTPSTRSRLTLHHYALKSKDEFEEKMLRKGGDGIVRGWSYWNHMEKNPHQNCTSLKSYIP
jgi:Glycosyl transferase family 2